MSEVDSNKQLRWYHNYLRKLWNGDDIEIPYIYDYPLCFVLAKRIACAKKSYQASNRIFQNAVNKYLLKRCADEITEADLQLLDLSWEIYYNKICRDITTIAELEQVWASVATYLRWHCYQSHELDVLWYDQRLFMDRYKTLSIFQQFMDEWRVLINQRVENTLCTPLLDLDIEQFREHKKKFGLPVGSLLSEDSIVFSDTASRMDASSQATVGNGHGKISPAQLLDPMTYNDIFDLSYIDTVYDRYKSRINVIVSIIGRTQEENSTNVSVVSQMLQYSFPQPPYEDIEGITIGKDILNVIPSELPSLCSSETDSLFYQKYACQQLQSFSSFPKEMAKKVKQQSNAKHQNGPIIVSIDSSGSMGGFPFDFARMMVLRIFEMVRKQKRLMFLVEFSDEAQCIDLTGEDGEEQLSRFLTEYFMGGTNGEGMFYAVLDQLESETYCNADVLIISDFEFDLCTPKTIDRIRAARNLGTRFYGINPSDTEGNTQYGNIMDTIWKFYK
ncbi:MAG: hypothetical protein MJZ84_04040 [Paludibacteraceae bacterium]|nr:hypothetical protein [Paludibacteraceae bacterium]